MNFDTKYIEKIKNNPFRHMIKIHIYKKRKLWERWNLKNYQIILLFDSIYSMMKIVKIFNKQYINFEKECNELAVLFIDINNTYLYFDKTIYEIEMLKFDINKINYPIYAKRLNYEIKDTELNKLINSYKLMEEFI